MKIGGIYLSVSAKTTQLKRDLAKAKTMTKKAAVLMNREIGRVSFAKVALASAALGVGMVMLTKKVISLGREFESTMKTVQAWSGATGKELKGLTDIARKMGATTEHTATQSAEALKFLAAAGFSAKKSIAALPATLNLATAGQVDLASATDITTDVLTAFKLETEDLNRVNDAFITTASNSNTNVMMLGQSFKMAAPTAHLFKMSIEETAAMLGTLANSGVKAEMAGSGLNMVLLRSAKAAKKLGLEAGTPLIEILRKMKEEQWGAVKIGEAFGARQVKTAAILMNNIDMYEKLTKKIKDNKGATTDLAKIIRDSLDVDIKTLNSTIQEELLRTFDKYKDYIRETVQATTEWIRQNPQVIEQIASLSKNMFELAANMGKVIGLGVQLAGSWSDITKAMGLASAGIITWGEAFSGATAAMEKFGTEEGRLKLRMAFLTSRIDEIKKRTEGNIFHFRGDIEELKSLQTALENAQTTLEKSKIATATKFAFDLELAAMESRAKEMIEQDKFAAGLPPEATKGTVTIGGDVESKEREIASMEAMSAAYRERQFNAELIAMEGRAQRMADTAMIEQEYIEKILEAEDAKFDAQVKLDEKLIDNAEDTANDMADAFAGWGREFSGTLNEMFWGAETTFGDILKSFGKMITQMMIQKSIIEPMFGGGSSGKGLLGGLLSAGIGALGGGFTSTSPFTTAAQQGISNVTTLWGNGGAFAGGISGFSNGIVNRPTRFNFASGAGLMGEAGPEAIMPLTRTTGGDLGVKTEGGGGSTIIINAIDSKSFAEVVKRNPQSIITVIDGALKDRTGLRDTMRSTL